ncbi:tudor domain-containing protein 1 isoform X2 [Nothoprocta perdicaria]|uniref:tudor domain-containing protein 1 isoform X2 n=1 Tax=Nothoprocta perdicaria TaxID=30464 RepID=UPI000E1B7B79|nr:tudor domain-containing protein 1 isoform X2 [Nothoprocta perdicaria]
MMAQPLRLKNKGNSAEGVIHSRKSWLTAAVGEGNAGPHSDVIQEKPKRQYSSENVFSIGYDESLFSSLALPSPKMTCHHCGLFGSLRCSQCKQIYYCSADCQKKDWRTHGVVCKPIKQDLSSNNGDKAPAKAKRKVYLKGNSASVDSLKIQEHIKKIMLSDLQTVGLKKAMEIKGIVTEFRNPSEFYIQISSPEFLEHINRISVELQDCYANTVIQEEYIPIKGEVCVAKYSLDQTWNRALVKDVDIVQKKAQIFYIDYGNEENISFSRIKALHKNIELFPPCVIKCSLANYDPTQDGWSDDIASSSPQFMGKHCSVTVVDILQEEMMLSFAVDVTLPDSGKCLDEVLSEVRSDLSSKNNAMGTDSPRENHSKGNREKMPEDKELVLNTDAVAKCVSVCIGDVFSGVVSHIQTPENFFCQQMQSGHRLAELQVSLGEYCEKVPSSPNFRPAVGNVCCAQFSEDSLWYRAAVLAYTSEDTVLVGYIDYGNFEVLHLTKLRPMIQRLMDFPVQVIRCTLAGVKPLMGTWTVEAISVMKQLVQDKVLTVKVVDKKGNSSVVELLDASVTPGKNISSYLIEKGCAAEESKMNLPAIKMTNVKEEGSDTANKNIWMWSKLCPKQTVDVIVCTLYNPGEFYCQISNDSELLALNSLNKSLSEYCQKTPPSVFKPKNGEPCCAFFSADGNWYRALVQNVTSDGAVKVCFVDYGNVEEVPLDKIRQISSSFLKLPFQGIKCWLSGIKPINSKWIPEATARFHMYAAGSKLQARVVSFSSDGAGVELIDNSTGCPKVINEMLTCEQLAVKEVLRDKNKCPNKFVDKKESSPGQWKSVELAIGETLSVCVTEVLSPDLFYVVPIQTRDQETPYQQLADLEEYCRSCNKQPFNPKVGEVCCAKFSGDGRWYRALVLKVSQSLVRVLYADYGNTETLPLSSVLPITESYLKLPFKIIKCSLAGIKKAEWPPLLLDMLKEMLLNKHVTITVKGISGNVNLVVVEKLSENGSLNVAEKLVTEGLVKYSSTENLPALHQGCGSETKCCCADLSVQLKKHEQILLFLLNKYGNCDGFSEMKKLLD